MAGSSTADRPSADAAFYLDLSSPEAWLSAERILPLMPVPCEWVPVRVPFAGGFRCAEEEEIFRAEIERRAPQPVRWPAEFPFDSGIAQLAATYARAGGKTVAFCLAAFRQAYAGGRSMSDPHNVTIAGAASAFGMAHVIASPRLQNVAAPTTSVTTNAGRVSIGARTA